MFANVDIDVALNVGAVAGGLEKARIWKLTNENALGDSLTVMFNPKELAISKQNDWQQQRALTKETPTSQYTGGGPESLTLQLQFDTYTAKEPRDVREEYQKIKEFMQIDGFTKPAKGEQARPPLVRFHWGTTIFDGVISTLNERLTLFLPGGTPVRAVVDLTLTQIRDGKPTEKQNPTSGGVGGERVWTVREGETLSWIAYMEYDNAADWRRIADANRLTSVRDLKPGTRLVIPNA